MANTINPRPIQPIMEQVQQLGIQPRTPLWQLFQDLVTRSDKTQTNLGEIRKEANITGRTEALSSTLQNVDSAGKLTTADAVAADGSTYGRVSVNALTSGNVDMAKAGVTNKSTDNLSDGTGSPLTGGKRGFVALDSNNRLSSSFRNTPLNVSHASTSATIISNDGTVTSNLVAADTKQFGPGTVAYNSGSYDPGVFGTSYAVTNDPTFSGGALAISFSSTPPNQANGDGNVLVGKILSLSGTPATGGGYTKGGSRGLNV